MNTPSMDQHAFFNQHGWLVLRGVVSGESLIPVLKAFDEISQLAGSHPEAPRIWQIPGAGTQNRVLLQHIHDGLAEFVAHLLDAGCIQLLQDTLIVKPARVGARVELHQDYAHTGFLQPANAASIRLSLIHSTVERGCMYVIDRSHHWGLQSGLSIFSKRLQQDVAEQLPSQFRSCVDEDRIPIELGPGDVSIHHCLTYHGSFENKSDQSLKTIVAHVFDGGCKLATDRLPVDAIPFFNTDAEGRLSTASFPLLFDHSLLRNR